MPSRSIAKFGSSEFNVSVDTREVEDLMARAMMATSGGSLAIFLDTAGQEYLHEEIGFRFAYEGDAKSGNWPPLAEGTEAIRHALGYPSAHPINVRTGDMEKFLEENDEIVAGPDFAVLDVPGETSDPVMRDKLTTAQIGREVNPIPGFGPTPARPVLAINLDDMVEVMDRLAAFIVYRISGLV